LRVLSGLRYIYEARLGARASLIQEGFAVLGIAVGVALLFASQVSSTSLTHAAAQINSQLVGSAQLQLKARDYEGFSEQLAQQVRRVPGVSSTFPILERQANLTGPRGERTVDLIGVQPTALKTNESPLLRRFSVPQLAFVRAIALPSHLASEIGVSSFDRAELQVGTKYEHTVIGAILEEADIGGLVHSPVAVTSLGYAQKLTEAPGRITRIFVRYEPGRSRQVRVALGVLARRWDVNLGPSTLESQVFSVAVAPESTSEQVFSGISALVGFMFALNAMLITVPSRRKLIADLRPHGAIPTVTVLLIDAAAIGMLACVLGLILGDLLSLAVFNATPGYLAFAFPVGNGRIITGQAVALAVGVGMIAATAGVLWPLRDVVGGSREDAKERPAGRRSWALGRLAAGLTFLAITTLALAADTNLAVVGDVTLVLSLLCLLPFLFDGAVASFARLSNVLNDVGSGLATSELEAPQTRVRHIAIAATAALAVFGTVEFGGTQTNLTRGLDASIQGMDSSANLWVVPGGASSLQTTFPFQAIDTSALASLPGVRQLSVYRGSFLDWGKRRVWVIAPAPSIQQPIPPTQLTIGTLSLAVARVQEGGWAVLSQSIVAERRLHVGQSFTLPSPRPTALRLAGVSSNLGWPPGTIIMNSVDYAHAWESQTPSAYQIQTTAGTDPGAERLVVHRALAGLGLSVQTSKEREQLHYAAAAQGLSRLTQIRILILVAAILAVVGAITAMLWSRRDQIAAMKCHGIEEGKLWLSLLCESGVVLAAGCSIGALFGVYGQLLLSHALATVTGFPIVFDIEGVAAITSFALVTVTAVAVLAVPGYLVVRVRPSTLSPAY
jgi:putative ABC transport system permease protein